MFTHTEKINGMTWSMVYSDKGLRREKISSIQAPAGIGQVYSIRIIRSARGLVYRDGEFMRFLEDYVGVYERE